MSVGRIAWLRVAIGQFIILRHPKDDEDKEAGPTVRLYLPRPGARPMQYNLTALTKQELDWLRDLLNLACDLAEPIVEHRDKVAQDAFDNGDDSFARIYRQVPQLIVRERAFEGHGEGVYDGSSGVPFSEWRGGRKARGVRRTGDELAPDEQDEGLPEDERTEDDEPESIR